MNTDGQRSREDDSTVTVTVERATSTELHRRHANILQRLGMTRDEIGELAAQYALTPEELAAWDELRSVEFLLEDE
ncbi:hypothetical protein GCM10023318_06150 [Nocardia callitridis]|uniref:Uncharacterized protein n=1 Tax=Nocardia callitridis TaxID=648753 RepID=A0ABP9JWH9_9NOCA